MDGRLFSIGDIHGRSDLLRLLLFKLKTEQALDLSKDKLIFLGDYVDRGPDSKGALEIVRSLDQKFPNVICLYGNHEDLMIRAIEAGRNPNEDNSDSWYWWRINGGESTVQSFGGTDNVNHKVPDEMIEWLDNLPFFHEEPGFFFSHAPLPRDNRRLALNIGGPFVKEEYIWGASGDEFGFARILEKDGERVMGVCGHVKKADKEGARPRFYPHYIYTDTGCGCFRNRGLAAVEVRTQQVIMAEPHELNPSFEAHSSQVEALFNP